MAPLGERTLARLEALLGDFPDRSEALLSALYIVQEEENHLTAGNLSELAAILRMPKSHVYQAATFYSLFDFRPLGRHVIRVCASICCWLRGSDLIEAKLSEVLGIGPGETTPDGLFTLKHSECLAACDRAPCMQVDGAVFGPLSPADVERIVREYREGKR